MILLKYSESAEGGELSFGFSEEASQLSQRFLFSREMPTLRSTLWHRTKLYWFRTSPLSKLFIYCLVVFSLFFFLYARHTPSYSDASMRDIPQLIQWAKEAGMNFPQFKIIPTSKGKALIANEDVPPGDIFNVPFSILFSGQMNSKSKVINSPGWKLINSLDSKVHWTETLLLLYEMQLGEESWFKWYLNTLTPRKDLSQPFLWTNPEEIQNLEGEYMRWWLINDTKKSLETYWTFVEKLVKDNQNILNPQVFTYSNFEWAATTIWARSFSVYRKLKPTVTVAVPIVDFMNHDFVDTWWEVDEAKEEWILKSRKGFKVFQSFSFEV